MQGQQDWNSQRQPFPDSSQPMTQRNRDRGVSLFCPVQASCDGPSLPWSSLAGSWRLSKLHLSCMLFLSNPHSLISLSVRPELQSEGFRYSCLLSPLCLIAITSNKLMYFYLCLDDVTGHRTISKLIFGCLPLKNLYLGDKWGGKGKVALFGKTATWEDGRLISQRPSSPTWQIQRVLKGKAWEKGWGCVQGSRYTGT